jgi:hypothetical protein
MAARVADEGSWRGCPARGSPKVVASGLQHEGVRVGAGDPVNQGCRVTRAGGDSDRDRSGAGRRQRWPAYRWSRGRWLQAAGGGRWRNGQQQCLGQQWWRVGRW